MNIFKRAWLSVKGFFLRNGGFYPMSLGDPDFEKEIAGLERNSLYVQNIYNKISGDVAMLKFKHVKITRRKDKPDLMDYRENSDLQTVLTVSPNPYETPTAFWSRVTYEMLKNNVAIVIPQYEEGSLVNLTLYKGPHEYTETGEIELTIDHKSFLFNVSDLWIFENPKHNISIQLNNITRIIDNNLKVMTRKLSKSGSRLKGLLRLNTKAADDFLKEKAKERVNSIMEVADSGGVGYLDKDEEFIELNNEYQTITTQEIDQIKNMLFQAFGLNEKLFTCDYTEEQYRAYFSGVLKLYQRVISEEINRKFFTKTARTQGQRLLVYYDMFEIASLKDLSDFAFKAKYSALMSSNEIREIFGYGGYEGGDLYQSNLNAVSVDELTETDNNSNE